MPDDANAEHFGTMNREIVLTLYSLFLDIYAVTAVDSTP